MFKHLQYDSMIMTMIADDVDLFLFLFFSFVIVVVVVVRRSNIESLFEFLKYKCSFRQKKSKERK